MDNEKRAGQLRNQIAGLEKQRRETERKLAQEQEKLRQVTARRDALVESLNGADENTAQRVHRDLDSLESTIRVSQRIGESLEKALQKTVHEIQSLTPELVEVELAIAAERNAAELRAFEVELKQARRLAEAALADARLNLAAFSALAVRCAERFGAAGAAAVGRELEPFVLQQANLGSAGWQEARPQYRPLQFVVRPMVRG